MPDASTHRPTPTGSRSITTPRASRVSAEPLGAVALRLPCLQTWAPAPAATKAAAVDTLKAATRRCGLPPVPHVSIRSPVIGSGSAASSMAASNPHSSSWVGRFMRSAIRKAAIWAGLDTPDMIACMADAASAWDSDSPSTKRSRTSGQPRPASVGDVTSVPPEVAVEHAFGDEAELDLAGALDDRELLGVAVVQLQRVVLHVAGGPEELEADVRRLHRHLGGVVLAHGEARD